MRLAIIMAAIILVLNAWDIAHRIRPDVIPETVPVGHEIGMCLFAAIACVWDLFEVRLKKRK
jgi:hypothetical protein